MSEEIPAPQERWPDAAAILDASGTVFCSGTLITDSLVLSAGHCSGRAETIVLDSHNLSQNLGITRNIRRTWQYPDYLNTLDIAVFELDEAVSIAPRALAVTCLADNYLADDASVQIVGFGATDVDGTDFPQALMQASTLVLDATCTTPERDCNASVYPWGELIAGGGGVDSCVGDSGGPLYIPTPHGTFLAGVTSRGIKPATTSCGEGGIYVRAEAAVDWIETETKSMLPKPDCASLGLNQRPQPTDQRLDVTEPVTTVQIHPNDPDEGQSHQFSIETAPTMGTASVDDAGWMTYTTSQITPFTDSVVIRVTDDGTPHSIQM